MRITLDIPATASALDGALEGLVCTNVALLDASPLPPLYRSGVRYQRERQRREVWQTCAQAFAAGVADCEDLAAWRAAELRRAGESEACAFATKVGSHTWHVRTRRADGTIEDPSIMLGMEPP